MRYSPLLHSSGGHRLQMIVGFFAGAGDYNDVGALLNSLSAEYPATWFYSVDTDLAQDVADRCNISAIPSVQVTLVTSSCVKLPAT